MSDDKDRNIAKACRYINSDAAIAELFSVTPKHVKGIRESAKFIPEAAREDYPDERARRVNAEEANEAYMRAILRAARHRRNPGLEGMTREQFETKCQEYGVLL